MVRILVANVCILLILYSCTGDNVVTDYNRAKIFGTWKFDSMTVNSITYRDTFKQVTFNFTSDEKLIIQKKDSTIQVPCYIFNSNYSNYVTITQIVDSQFLFLNRKWNIGTVNSQYLRLDYLDFDLKEDYSLYFNR